MIFPFTYQAQSGDPVEDCCAFISDDPYEPDEWTITDVSVDDHTLKLDDPLREPMIEWLINHRMDEIAMAWRFRDREAA